MKGRHPSRRAMATLLPLLAAAACDGTIVGSADAPPGADADAAPPTASDGGAGATDAGARDAGLDAAPGDGGAGAPDAGGAERIPVVVAVGANHARYLSLDEGATWCAVDRADDPGATGFDNPFLLRNVTYADGRFVAGSWRAIWVSSNGYAWEDVTGDANPAFGQWTAQVAYGNGWWVATGGYGTAMRSRDLRAWEVVNDELPGNEASRSLAFGDGWFVTARDAVGWWQSADGTGWTQRDASGPTRIVFEDGAFRERPRYDRGRGVRLTNDGGDGIARAPDAEGAAFVRVADVADTVTRFAFGSAPAADYAPGVPPAALEACLAGR